MQIRAGTRYSNNNNKPDPQRQEAAECFGSRCPMHNLLKFHLGPSAVHLMEGGEEEGEKEEDS